MVQQPPARNDPIVDINCFVGYWPFRRIPYRTVTDIRDLMGRTKAWRALVTPLAGLFYKDCLSAVREMIEEMDAHAGPGLLPVAVVNPAFPGWEDDLATLVDDWGCVALRLFPNYHGYRLPDPQAAELLRIAESRGLPVMISVRVQDERLHHWLVRVEPVSCLDITWVLRMFPEVRVVLCDVSPDEVDQLRGDIVAHAHASVDTSARMPQFYVEELVAQLASERVVYGTGMPLKYPECALRQLQDAHLAKDERRKILCGNACRVFQLDLGMVQDR